jgi:glycosyltransferase involved in cell wall biosynthesis
MNHIAFILPGIDRVGGAERQVLLLAKGMRRRGWQVSVVALSGAGGAQASELMDYGIQFVSLRMRKGLADPRGWLRFHHWLKRERPGVVHAHLPHAAWFARWSRLAAPMCILVDTVHSTCTGTLGRKLGYRWSNWLPDRVTAVSQAVAEAYLQARMATAEKLITIPNGVDVNEWRPDGAARAIVRTEIECGSGEFLWLAAGRLDPVKGYATLLAAMAMLPQTARLAIAGAGPLLNDLRRRADALGVVDRVRFLGFEPDVRRWMHAADGFVLSSLWEGLPMALLEAAACALPAVATDIPGTREAVADGQTGLLCAPGNVPALQDAMTRMMQMTLHERRAMGSRARDRVVASFSLERALDRWEALYAETLKQNPVAKRWSSA